ncbi:hypothetical protein CRM22_004017 [Opisthorchis felineus]|uniref:G-protein coupled receptors family 1 profile domain-containing protein n=1 Tax=Opisthorchis felineus TaxID=147828 RepID=A0A4S2M4L2_OPIFE|nr:hypothetical protein CRM22_004017 [Opisthorchis felineus]
MYPAEIELGDIPYELYMVRIAVFTFGFLLNLLMFIILIRFRKPTDNIIITGIVPTAIDALICMVNVASFAESRVKQMSGTQAYIICHLISSYSILWALIAARVFINMLVTLFFLIQFLYPFMRIEQRRKPIRTVIIVGIPLSMATGIIPHLVTNRYAASANQCTTYSGAYFYAPMRLVTVFRLGVLVSFLYNFLLPVIGSIYLYHHVLRMLRLRDKNRDAYKEVHLCNIMDNWFMLLFTGMAELEKLMVRYPNTRHIQYSPLRSAILMLILSFYSVVYPCLSIVFRRRYQRPILDCLIYMGMNPTDSWLAKRLNRSEVSESRKQYTKTSEYSHRKPNGLSSHKNQQ